MTQYGHIISIQTHLLIATRMINAIDFSQVFAEKKWNKNPKSTKVAISLIRIYWFHSIQFNQVACLFLQQQ